MKGYRLAKKVTAIVAVAALVCGLCGCANSSGTENAPKEATADQAVEPVTVSYSLQLDITCQENLLFSRYDVNVLIDGTSIGILDHGASKTYEIDLEEGSHTLTVEKEDDSAVDGSVDFEITQESYASCNLALSSDQVAIEDFQIISITEKEKREKAAQEKAAIEEEARKKEEAQAQAAQEEAARRAQEEEAKAAQEKAAEEEARKREEEEAKAAEERMNTPLTADNDADFAEFLDSEDYGAISSFANSHIGQVIEFDGNVADVAHHEGFDTRFDYLIYVGDYSETSAHGPIFQFEDVNYYDLNLADGSPDTIGVGLNLRIKAKIVDYDSNADITKLDPIEVSVR
ncbi:DUF4839 domain-containing protein [Xiamenia xianingshaonis]|uniref:DUF4839 domain-containing protein n=1 Tax=Xiamenia xianingshaonis TaxID=2682776 RepID=A0ABX0IG50_9ACTN|nr:DUF4839 domain-containing protein [Xiamenia xianingshaonis]NHM13583.1 DUF4839 domain-containing protein [Xiamenia xianingshaonis]